MTNFGYVRVSSKDQNEARQIHKMKELGIEERFIFIDKLSGKDFDRPQYLLLKRFIQKGDLIYIDALDRLGRNYDGILQEWKEITRILQADIIVLENAELFDSRKFRSMGDMGKMLEDQFLSLLAYAAEQERKRILLRQAEGIAAAKASGQTFGRPSINYINLTTEQKYLIEKNYERWKSKKITAVEFMKLLDLKKNTFYKVIKQYGVRPRYM
ncbi:recombinase family protein [Robertmurraya yapensis]|uniref:Recombinase family protein n=2 Tax=Bacillaceae TaxID=186817 RepID=A0A431VTJ9_9BACI|nr:MULTISPECIES: recombinase family protein [Bacillaceae]RTR26545.1 recombinase family protein [Bacillus yapensis]TKC15092.1 recombinase family protein [Robertmurraya kyonggiensis]TKS93720.1 recombinase family protein [Bacillus yapensis]